jgi:hypothetical protein
MHAAAQEMETAGTEKSQGAAPCDAAPWLLKNRSLELIKHRRI